MLDRKPKSARFNNGLGLDYQPFVVRRYIAKPDMKSLINDPAT